MERQLSPLLSKIVDTSIDIERRLWYDEIMLANTSLNKQTIMSDSEAFAALAKSLRELGFTLLDVTQPDSKSPAIGGFLWEKDGKRFFQDAKTNDVTEV